MAYFKALEAAGASHYRKMLDASGAEGHLSEAETAELAAYAKWLKWQGTPGPMAIFTGSSGNDAFLRSVGAMLRPGQRLRTFSTIHEARRWLDRAPLERVVLITGRDSSPAAAARRSSAIASRSRG
jgi:hypothetical protein